jgi:hypothetical protein
MSALQQDSILLEPFATERGEVEERLTEVMSAARRKAVEELESYHAFGPKFTKFDDFEPLERQDAEATKRLEREAILGVREFAPEVVGLKIDVFGAVAVTTFVMEYEVVTEQEEHFSFRARATMVFANDEGEWLIVHEHFSPFVENS